MNSTERIFHHANKAFKIADEAFAEADKAFAEMDRFFEAREEFNVNESGTVHRLRFQADTWSKRWRLCWHFIKLAFLVVWNGSATFQFKKK